MTRIARREISRSGESAIRDKSLSSSPSPNIPREALDVATSRHSALKQHGTHAKLDRATVAACSKMSVRTPHVCSPTRRSGRPSPLVSATAWAPSPLANDRFVRASSPARAAPAATAAGFLSTTVTWARGKAPASAIARSPRPPPKSIMRNAPAPASGTNFRVKIKCSRAAICGSFFMRAYSPRVCTTGVCRTHGISAAPSATARAAALVHASKASALTSITSTASCVLGSASSARLRSKSSSRVQRGGRGRRQRGGCDEVSDSARGGVEIISQSVSTNDGIGDDEAEPSGAISTCTAPTKVDPARRVAQSESKRAPSASRDTTTCERMPSALATERKVRLRESLRSERTRASS